MKTLSFFFRHAHPIYFSIEKLFHEVAAEAARQLAPDINVVETELPFTSSFRTIWKNLRFTAARQTAINHITGDVQYAILACSKTALNILTVHDCVLLYQYPRTSLRRLLILWLWYRLPVKKADVITAISENTKRDLIHFTGCKPEKIVVIPNFLDPAFQVMRRPFNTGLPVVLFIGTAPNKNLSRVIEAVAGLTVHLLIVGNPSGPEQAEIKRLGISCRVSNGLTNEEMRAAYSGADLLLFPSLHEGFGLPVIEAQATGRPVITSRREPMLSVAGDGACFVDPLSASSIREALLKVIGDNDYRETLIQKGLANVRRFRLEAVAAQYMELYRNEKIK